MSQLQLIASKTVGLEISGTADVSINGDDGQPCVFYIRTAFAAEELDRNKVHEQPFVYQSTNFHANPHYHVDMQLQIERGGIYEFYCSCLKYLGYAIQLTYVSGTTLVVDVVSAYGNHEENFRFENIRLNKDPSSIINSKYLNCVYSNVPI